VHIEDTRFDETTRRKIKENTYEKGTESMIKYFGAAFALKVFSLSKQTRKFYRFLGNTLGARKRAGAGLPLIRIYRAKRILSLFEKYNISREGARLLELGTGWVHWESTVLRLFYNAQFTLFDVWDNRQFRPFKTYISEFSNKFDREIKIQPTSHDHAKGLLGAIASVNSFAQLYKLLGFEYVLEPTGTLKNLESGAYDACFSYNVFEHIDREIVSEYIKDLYRILKPGGHSLQTIDMSDHLVYYDKGVCIKNYLRFSDGVWKLVFENKVQYFNRIQRSDWLSMFSQAGFELLDETATSKPIHTKVNRKYGELDERDIECTMLSLVHIKPSEKS
jgi:hypothetical protein